MSRRPYKITAKKWDEYLRLISEEGFGRAAAAQAIGVTRQCVNAYRDNRTADPEGKRIAQFDEAESRRDDQVVNSLFMAATSGNVTACLAWLYSRRPEDWADMRHLRAELTGPGGGPVQSVSRVDLSSLSLDELKALRDIRAKLDTADTDSV